MIIVIGEILIDRFPEYDRIGGAPFNFAFHLKNMGWPIRFITRIGDDANGRRISQMLEKNGFDPQDVQIDPDHATGLVEVTLDDNGIPQFDICEDAAYDHIDLSSVRTAGGPSVDMIYFGTLIQRATHGFQQVQSFLTQHGGNTTCFCDINLRAPHIRAEAIEPSLRHADILKLNDEELEKISALCSGPTATGEILEWLMREHCISKIALTRGAEGSTFVTKRQSIDSARATVSRMVDTVGAGDAYASIIAAGILKQLPINQTLTMATDFAAQICGMPGAIPDSRHVYAALQNEFERIRDAQ